MSEQPTAVSSQSIDADSAPVNVQGRLRNRLLVLILLPLFLVTLFFSYETYQYSTKIAQQAFDKSLSILSITLMEQADTLNADALSEEVLESITNSLGHVFFYQLRAPNSIILAGYANAPIADEATIKAAAGRPQLFIGEYRGQPVRAVYLRNFWNNQDYSGWVGMTVWQFFDAQTELRNELFIRSLLRLMFPIALVALALLFGIDYSLKPLRKLQNSINRRSIDDLTLIQQSVPLEVGSLVASMNKLLSRLSAAIRRRESFLGNASHQLKTPLANIRSRAELALTAKDPRSQKSQIQSLIAMTDQTSRLATQMLSLLRAESQELLAQPKERVDLVHLVREVCEFYAPIAVKTGRELVFEHDGLIELDIRIATPTMLSESIGNLIENSIAYSKAKASINVRIERSDQHAHILVQDAGPGIPAELQESAQKRFYRVPGTTADGCGIGLSIVSQTLKNLDGELIFKGPKDDYFVAELILPLD